MNHKKKETTVLDKINKYEKLLNFTDYFLLFLLFLYMMFLFKIPSWVDILLIWAIFLIRLKLKQKQSNFYLFPVAIIFLIWGTINGSLNDFLLLSLLIIILVHVFFYDYNEKTWNFKLPKNDKDNYYSENDDFQYESMNTNHEINKYRKEDNENNEWKESSPSELEKFQKYKDDIYDLKERYQNTEDTARKIIKEHFPPPQMTYNKFMDEIDNWTTIFIKQSELALNIIDIAPRYTKEIEDEIVETVNTLKSIVDKMEKLAVELTINLSNSSQKSDVGEVKELLSEMQKVIDSVKEYD